MVARRLVAPATDLAFVGASLCIGAVPLFVLAFVHAPAGGTLFDAVFTTIGFGTIMYLVQRARLRLAVKQLDSPPTLEHEPRGATLGRAAVVGITQATTLVVLAFAFRAVGFATVDTFALCGGIGAGGGLTMLLMARWLHAWERVHREHLLAEVARLRPPWSWRPKVEWTSRPVVLYCATSL